VDVREDPLRYSGRFYASWFGYDADGNVAALVTDFQTIEWTTARW
jgi:hypothetical protein